MVKTASPETFEGAPKDLPVKTGPSWKHCQYSLTGSAWATHSNGEVGVVKDWSMSTVRGRVLACGILDRCKRAHRNW